MRSDCKGFGGSLLWSVIDSVDTDFHDQKEEDRSSAETRELLTLKGELCSLSAAYAISGFESFAIKAEFYSRGHSSAKRLRRYCQADGHRFATSDANSHYFDGLYLVEVVLSAMQLDESSELGKNGLGAFRNFARQQLRSGLAVVESENELPDLLELLARALQLIAFSRFLDDEDALATLESHCEEVVFPRLNSLVERLTSSESRSGDEKFYRDWVEIYLAIVYWYFRDSGGLGRRKCSAGALIEKLIPLWGNVEEATRGKMPADSISYLTQPSIALLLGMGTGSAHFLQLWEDLMMVTDLESSSPARILSNPLLWYPDYGWEELACRRKKDSGSYFRGQTNI